MIKKDYYKEYSELRIVYKGLLKGNIELSDENKMLKEEIERLNNIINELEKYTDGRIEYCYESGCYEDIFDVYNEYDMKIKELKGSDKE